MLETEIVQKLSLCAYKVLVRTYNTQIFKENENICIDTRNDNDDVLTS